MTISKQLFLLNHKRTHRIQTCMLVEFRITYFPSFFSLVKMNKVTILFLMALQYRDFTHLQYYPISSSFSSSSPPAPRLSYFTNPLSFSPTLSSHLLYPGVSVWFRGPSLYAPADVWLVETMWAPGCYSVCFTFDRLELASDWDPISLGQMRG